MSKAFVAKDRWGRYPWGLNPFEQMAYQPFGGKYDLGQRFSNRKDPKGQKPVRAKVC